MTEPSATPSAADTRALRMALAYLSDGRPEDAERCLSGRPPEVLVRLAALADAACQLCLALAQHGPIPDGVAPEVVADAATAQHVAVTSLSATVPLVSLQFSDDFALLDEEDGL